MENNHTFPSPDEKDTENIENKKPEESQTRQNSEEKAAGDGSYEIVFGSQNGGDSRYSANGYNAYGFNANGSSYRGGAEAYAGSAEKSTYTPRFSEGKKNKKQTRVTVMLTLSVVFLAISVMLSAMTIYLLRKNNPQYTLKSPTGDSGNITPWVNPSELQYEDAYANAASKAVDSVVMISATTQNSTSSGSGLIWVSRDSLSYSYILTCNHVIEGQNEIKVTLNNNTTYYAEVVGTDSRTDIAVLKINASGLPAVVLPSEDSELVFGQSVIAIGNPLGVLGNTVTDGILSSLARTITVEGTTMEVIQTSAAVNRGNSGGGLFDLNGQLIGMVNAKVGETAVEGIGFAIPYRTLTEIASELIEKGYVSGRPRLGITTVSIDSDDSYLAAIKEYPDLESYVARKLFPASIYYTPGVYVVDASDVASYAEGSDTFAFGDRITAIGTESVSSSDDITAALNGYAAGDSIQITVARKDRLVSISLTLGEMGK